MSKKIVLSILFGISFAGVRGWVGKQFRLQKHSVPKFLSWPFSAPLVDDTGADTSPNVGDIIFDNSASAFKGYTGATGGWALFRFKFIVNTESISQDSA